MGQGARPRAGARSIAVFDRGDVKRVIVYPIVGHDMSDDARPVLVLTMKAFNRRVDVLVAPITRGGGLESPDARKKA